MEKRKKNGKTDKTTENSGWLKLVEYNERKRQVLEYVARADTVTSYELARALNLEIHNARVLLKKYSRQGLLSRRRANVEGANVWGTKGYEITERGLRRLKWLMETL